MIDINNLRDNPDKFKKATKDKGYNPDVIDEVLRLDEERRKLIPEIGKLREERNIAKKENTPEVRERGRAIKKKLKDIEPRLKKIEADFNKMLQRIPNPATDDVPIGKDEKDNKVLRKVGKPPKFNFKARDHLELGEKLDIIDVKRAAKVSGSRFGYLKNEAVLLEFALVQFAMNHLIKNGFQPVVPPVLIKKESMQGMGYLDHGGDEDMFILEKDNLVLVGTSEQSIGPMHMDEVFDAKDLPRRYVGFSTCFRREAGSYGKDTRGILRVHQFDKIEMFSYTAPNNGDKEHELMLTIEEELMQALDIPYQVVQMCTGDLGAPAARKYDLEAWMPGQNKYREVTSTSTTTDFQSRRLKIKYKEEDKTDYLHMLNGTAFAIGRVLISIFENYQQKDGSVKIPKVLQDYVGKDIVKPIST
jgi:seryl-tRNA synthetase